MVAASRSPTRRATSGRTRTARLSQPQRAGLTARPPHLGPMRNDNTQREDGFTLIEMLVVCLIIAALAAIALPVFLSQQAKAQDADAKSNARNLVSHIEACQAST